MLCRSGGGPEARDGVRRGRRAGRSVRDFFVTGESAGKFHQLFRVLDFLSIFGQIWRIIFGRPFWCLCILWREYAIHVFHECSLSFLETSYFPQISHTLEKLIKLSSDLGPLLKNLGTDLPFLGTSPSGPPPDRLRPLRPLDRHAPHARPARPHSPSRP